MAQRPKTNCLNADIHQLLLLNLFTLSSSSKSKHVQASPIKTTRSHFQPQVVLVRIGGKLGIPANTSLQSLLAMKSGTLIPCQCTTETVFDTEHLVINNLPVNSATTKDAYIPDTKNTDNHANGKSQDESSSDQEMETHDLCPTNMYAEASEQTFEPQKED